MGNRSQQILIFVTFLLAVSLYTYVPVLALYAQQLGASYDMVGLIVGSYGLVQVFLRIPLGVFSDSRSCHKVFIILGMALSLVSSLGMWLMPLVGALLVFRVFSGAAASMWLNYTVLYANYFPPHEAPKALGFVNAVNSLGQVAGMLAGGYAAQQIGIQAAFMLSVAAAVIGVILAMFVYEEKRPRTPINAVVLSEAVKDDNLLRLSGLGIITQVITFVTVFGFLPVAGKELGASHMELGLLTTVAIVPSIVSSALSGSVFSVRLGERKTLVLGLMTMAVSSISIPFITTLPGLYISQGIGGFGKGLVFPLLMGLCIKNFAAHKRTTAMGVFQAAYGLGMFGGPVLAGLISSAFGLHAGFAVTGIIGLVGATLAGWPRYLPLWYGKKIKEKSR